MLLAILSTRSPCGSRRATPSPLSISWRIIVSSSVDLPVPVFPMTYIPERRSAGLIPKVFLTFRKLVWAKPVMRVSESAFMPASWLEGKALVSLGDDLKAAATDSLKKCATLFGVGLHLYFDQPYNEASSRNGEARPNGGDN